jgi:DNA-binding Lrp family transcriptional regulator
MKLDRVDRDILRELAADGRITNVDLARRVGLSPPPCLRRVKRLEQAGVIAGYRAVIDPAALGRRLEVTVSVEIDLTNDSAIERFEEAVLGLDEVLEARRLFGVPDYLLRVAVEDADAYYRFQTESLTKLPGVARIISHQTMTVLKGGV